MKRIRVDDEAYRLLEAAKLHPAESFSEVVERILRPASSLDESWGGWSDMADDEARALRRSTVEAFERERPSF